jgi:hypothetical protein
VDQGPDVHPFSNLVLDGEGKGTGVAYVPREARIHVVQDDDAQPHAIAAMVLAGLDVVNAYVSILVHHESSFNPKLKPE